MPVLHEPLPQKRQNTYQLIQDLYYLVNKIRERHHKKTSDIKTLNKMLSNKINQYI